MRHIRRLVLFDLGPFGGRSGHICPVIVDRKKFITVGSKPQFYNN